jgi:hypothetical protein
MVFLSVIMIRQLFSSEHGVNEHSSKLANNVSAYMKFYEYKGLPRNWDLGSCYQGYEFSLERHKTTEHMFFSNHQKRRLLFEFEFAFPSLGKYSPFLSLTCFRLPKKRPRLWLFEKRGNDTAADRKRHDNHTTILKRIRTSASRITSGL